MVYRGEQSPVGCCRLHVLVLLRCHAHVTLLLRGNFRRRGPRPRSAIAAVEADACCRGVLVDHRRIVDVVDHCRVYVGDGTVIEIFAAPPVTAIETRTGIPETVINAAVEAHGWSPISRVPNVEAFLESPVSGCPQKSHFRWKDPSARNPEVTVIAVRPVAGYPDVTDARTDWLHVDWEDRWCKTHRNDHAYVPTCFGLR